MDKFSVGMPTKVAVDMHPIELQPTIDIGAQHKKSLSVLVSCMIGNALEWYDFVIYGYFAVTLGSLFFPNTSPMVQILASWGIFWAGFIARPLGSIVFGHIGDKISRKSALTLSIYTMAIPTMLMGCLPTFEQIGVTAPVLLVLFRMMQGFAIGGEFTGSMVFLIEHAPQSKRGFWGSWASFSAVMGIIIGSLFIAGLNHIFSTEDINTWAWRIPFIVSVLGSVVGGYIRNRLTDPMVYQEAKAKMKVESLPLKELLQNYKTKIALLFFVDMMNAVGFFILAIFLATYFRKYLNYQDAIALSINTFNMCLFAVCTIIGGWLSDRYGRKNLLKYPCWGFILLSYPLFICMQMGNLSALIAAQAIFAMMTGILFGAIPAALAEIFPTSVRFTGLSLSHNICMAIIGGGTPFIASHLIHSTHNLLAPAFLLIGAGMISLFALRYYSDRASL